MSHSRLSSSFTQPAVLCSGLWLALLALASPSFPQEPKPLRVGLDPRSAPWAFRPVCRLRPRRLWALAETVAAVTASH